MSDQDPAIVFHFTKQTRKGEMRWERFDPHIEDYSNFSIAEAYLSEYKGENIRLVVENRVRSDGDVDYHFSRTRLYLVDNNGQLLWEFPVSIGLDDLLNTVRFQVNNVKDRLKKLKE